MKTGLIYIIKNTKNDKPYIGQTTNDLRTRFTQHCKKSVIANRHYKIYNAIKKYGKDCFYIELLEDNIPLDKLNEREIYYIEKYNSFENGYNSTKGGDGRMINKQYDEEEIIYLYTKEKQSTTKIAKLYNVNPVTICRVLARKGVAIRHDGNKYEDFGDEFVDMWTKGTPIKEIAHYFNVDEKTIRRAVKHYKLPLRHKRRLF